MAVYFILYIILYSILLYFWTKEVGTKRDLSVTDTIIIICLNMKYARYSTSFYVLLT